MNLLDPGPLDWSPILVERAHLALVHFGADIDQLTAAMLLPMWEHYRHLTPQEAAAVVARFRAHHTDIPSGVHGYPVGGATR